VLDLLTTALGSKQSMIQVDSSILNVSINIGLMIVAVSLSACASTDSRDDVAAGRADGEPGVVGERLEDKRLEKHATHEAVEDQRRVSTARRATGISGEEYELHHARRVELSRQQMRITCVYLMNLERRLKYLREEVSKYGTLGDDTNASISDSFAVDDIGEMHSEIAEIEKILTRHGEPDNRALVDCTDVSPACDAGGDCP